MAETSIRLLFDENLAARLVRQLGDLYPGSAHVGEVGLLSADDLAIWQHAGSNGFVLITKDEDFQRLSILFGPPPKVIWLRLGNVSTDDIIMAIRENRDEIAAFVAHDEVGFLALGKEST